jgi:hypothetical protein
MGRCGIKMREEMKSTREYVGGRGRKEAKEIEQRLLHN